MICLDANVFLAAVLTAEPHHTSSAALIARVREGREEACVPALFVPECVGAYARRTRRPGAIAAFSRLVRTFPVRLGSVDAALAWRAAEIAAACFIKGPDAIYVATAERAGATFVTWDAEVAERAAGVVRVETPAGWLASAA